MVTAKFKDAFWDMMHPVHEDWAVSHFVGVIKRHPVLDEDTKLLYGGTNGVRLFVLACLRIFYAVFRAETLQESQLSLPCAVSPSAVLDYLLTAVTLLNNEITRSTKVLRRAREEVLEPEYMFEDVSDDSSMPCFEASGNDTRMKSPSPVRVEVSPSADPVCDILQCAEYY